jgi:hypothetical protein
MRYFPPAVVATLLCCLAPVSLWAQKLSCSPCSFVFSQVNVGLSKSTYIQLTNTGNETLTILSSSIQGSAFSIGNVALPLNLTFGSSAQLEVIFTPTLQGQNTGVINLLSTAPDSPLSLNVSGTGGANSSPQLAISPSTLNFGKVSVGSNATMQASLTASNAPVTITSDQSSNSEFAIVGLKLPATIPAGTTVNASIQFTPTSAGAVSGKATFASNATNSPTVEQLSGTGTATANPQLAVSPATLSFGSVAVGSSVTKQATLSASNAAVTISSDQLSNSEFSIVGTKLPLTIAAGKSAAVTIQFAPSATGTVSGKATFVSNAKNSPTVEQLSGTGTAKSNPQLAISPATLSFGNVTVGSSTTLQATLTASNAAVTVSSAQSSNSEYSVVGLNLPLTIAAGKSATVTVQFAPTATGSASGKLTFVSNAGNSPSVEQLTGTGVTSQSNANLAVSPATLSFGNVNVGSSASKQATLTASHGSVTISSDQSNSSEFVIQGLNLPVTIASGKSATVTIQFTPNASGTASAKAGFISNAKNSPTVEQLAGTGVAQDSHQVDLTWSQGDPNAVGYNIYRGSAQSGPFTQINNALDAATNYTDSNVVSGTTYYYVATEVNAQGEESAYSNVVKAVVPNP